MTIKIERYHTAECQGIDVFLSQDKQRLKKETGTTECKWAGRRLIEFAVVGPKLFTNTLRGLSLEANTICLKTLEKLRRLDRHADVSKILDGFATAKNLLEARFLQYTSFLVKPPWNLVALLEFVLPNANIQESTNRSRALARKLLQSYDRKQMGNVGGVGDQFFSEHRLALTRWAKGHDHFMQQALFRQLVAWASSLLVMKRLEAKHHLVHVPRSGSVQVFPGD